MTRPLPALWLSASLLASFAAGSFVPVSAQTLDSSQSAPQSGNDGSKSASHSPGNSSALVLLGIVAGGAALMGGGHGSGSSLASSSQEPQMLYTPSVSSLPVTAPAAVISIPTFGVAVKTPAPVIAGVPAPAIAFAPVTPVIEITYPAIPPVTVTAAPVSVASVPTLDAPGNFTGFPVSPPSVPAVPEPGTVAALGIGSFLLAGLALRVRRGMQGGASAC